MSAASLTLEAPAIEDGLATAREAPEHVALSCALARLLLEVEESAATGPSRLTISTRDHQSELGLVMGEDGRVCWASSRTRALRLTDLLTSRTRLEPQELERIFQHCRESREPLGEYLIRQAAIEAEELRSTLRDHTVAALVTLANAIQEGATISHSPLQVAHSYNAMFTFSGSEIFLDAIRAWEELAANCAAIPTLYSELAADSVEAICLEISDDRRVAAAPVAATLPLDKLGLKEVTQLFRAARSWLSTPTLTAIGVSPFAVVGRHQDCGWLAVQFPRHLCLFRMDDRDQFGVLMTRVLKNLQQAPNERPLLFTGNRFQDKLE